MQEKEVIEIVRYGAPSIHDTLPQGTLCRVELQNGITQIWEQIAQDEEKPNWVLKDEIKR
jgi:hypothetical protein